MGDRNIKVGDLVFYLKDISEKVYDGTVLAINEDGSFQIHDETSGGTYTKIPANTVFTDRNDAEARNQKDFQEEVERYLAEISTVDGLLNFMFNTDLGIHGDEANWAARKAVKLEAKELLGIDLPDVIDGK